MTLHQIKEAVNNGRPVYWGSLGYQVVKIKEEWYIRHTGGHMICLTWSDGVTLNGEESQFFEPMQEGQTFHEVCGECKKGMNQGFVIGDGDEYYCSEECLHKHYSPKEWNQMYNQDEGYWTEWEPDDVNYIVKDGKIIEI